MSDWGSNRDRLRRPRSLGGPARGRGVHVAVAGDGAADVTENLELRRQWHELVKRIDELHDEAWAIQTNNWERITEIHLETQRCRARIAEIVAMGVTFDA